MEIHTGDIVLKKLKEKGVKKSELARMINTSRQNVQDMLKRQSLDSQLLLELSKALNFNFFESLSIQMKENGLILDTNPSLHSPKELIKNQIDELNQKLELAEKEILYL